MRTICNEAAIEYPTSP